MYAHERRFPYRACQSRDSFSSFMAVLGINTYKYIWEWEREMKSEQRDRTKGKQTVWRWKIQQEKKKYLLWVAWSMMNYYYYIMIVYKCTPIPTEHGTQVYNFSNRAMAQRDTLGYSTSFSYSSFHSNWKSNWIAICIKWKSFSRMIWEMCRCSKEIFEVGHDWRWLNGWVRRTYIC